MTDTEQTGATATITLDSEELEQLKKLYTLREPAEVVQVLEKYSFLVGLLLEAHRHIRNYFPNSPLFLQYVTDPEIDYPLLLVNIATNLDPEEAVDRLDKLDDWWVEVPNRDQGKLCIDVEFQ